MWIIFSGSVAGGASNNIYFRPYVMFFVGAWGETILWYEKWPHLSSFRLFMHWLKYKFTISAYIIFICPFEKRDVLWKHLRQAGVRCPQGFHSLNQRVFIRSLSNLVNMSVCIMSRTSTITSQIPPGTPELWPFNCPKLGFPLS